MILSARRPISSRQKMWELSGNKWLKNQSREQLLNQFRYRPCSSSFSGRLHRHTSNEKDKKLTNENSLILPSKMASFGRHRGGSWGTFVPSYFWGFSSGNLWYAPRVDQLSLRQRLQQIVVARGPLNIYLVSRIWPLSDRNLAELKVTDILLVLWTLYWQKIRALHALWLSFRDPGKAHHFWAQFDHRLSIS